MYRQKGSGIISALTVIILALVNFVFFRLVIPRDGELLLAKFVNPSYRWIVYLALSLLLFYMFSELGNVFNRQVLTAKEGASRSLTVLSLSIPLLFFLVAKDTYLTANMQNMAVLDRSPTPESATEPQGNQNPFLLSPNDAVPENDGETTILQLFMDRSEYIGKEVEIIGIAHRFPEFGTDKVFIYRLLVSCCAADAQPVGLVVQVDSLEGIEQNEWYRVRGIVKMVEVEGPEGGEYLGMRASEFATTEEPALPFLF